jgi:hypothetical protein
MFNFIHIKVNIFVYNYHHTDTYNFRSHTYLFTYFRLLPCKFSPYTNDFSNFDLTGSRGFVLNLQLTKIYLFNAMTAQSYQLSLLVNKNKCKHSSAILSVCNR